MNCINWRPAQGTDPSQSSVAQGTQDVGNPLRGSLQRPSKCVAPQTRDYPCTIAALVKVHIVERRAWPRPAIFLSRVTITKRRQWRPSPPSRLARSPISLQERETRRLSSATGAALTIGLFFRESWSTSRLYQRRPPSWGTQCLSLLESHPLHFSALCILTESSA